MQRLHCLFLDFIAWAFTRIWGHMLVPVLLGTIIWACLGSWISWEFIYWLTFVGGMLILGWLLTIVTWVQFYWDLYWDDVDRGRVDK